ncbi:MAG: hypothetical protein KHX19_02425 [Bifidobacterium longum]|nr:hypothetical protein [Bifidobacterium longum]
MNGIVVGLLPGVLWMVAVIFAVSIITITVSRGHLFTPRRRRPPVDPVDWSMVKTHFMSFAAALIPFPVLTFTADRAQLPGAIIVFALVLLELVAMYLQARNASESAMDGRLGVAARRDDDDAGIVPDRARSGNEGDMDTQGED